MNRKNRKRRKIKYIILIVLIVLLIFGGIYFFVIRENKSNNINKVNTTNTIKENKVEEKKYVDDNEIIIGLYKEFNDNHQRELVKEFNAPWILGTDITSFVAFATNEETISGDTFQIVWKDYWNKYNNEGYKIGYHIYFTTSDGHTFDKNILRPADVQEYFYYVQTYLYDDIHHDIGVWYSHVEDSEYTDQTILTSIKLFSSNYIDMVNSPIKLTVFTYNDNDDFDSNTGLYRGNSKYEITINKSN